MEITLITTPDTVVPSDEQLVEAAVNAAAAIEEAEQQARDDIKNIRKGVKETVKANLPSLLIGAKVVLTALMGGQSLRSLKERYGVSTNTLWVWSVLAMVADLPGAADEVDLWALKATVTKLQDNLGKGGRGMVIEAITDADTAVEAADNIKGLSKPKDCVETFSAKAIAFVNRLDTLVSSRGFTPTKGDVEAFNQLVAKIATIGSKLTPVTTTSDAESEEHAESISA